MRRTIPGMAPSLQIGQTLLGRSGVPYHLREVLYERKENKDVVHRLWVACSNSGTYVVKPVTPFQYDQAFRMQKELSSNPFIRLPIDGNETYKALVFQHYTEDFLRFMQSGPASRSQVKQILLSILKGVASCHDKDWVHSDIKPSNILISYRYNLAGTREIDRVALADIEDAAKVKTNEGIFAKVGNVLWRSPEAQIGIRVGKASDIWSFGVTALYGITKMVIFAYDELEEGVLPEVEVLSNMLSYFGPLPQAFLEHIGDPQWCSVLVQLDQSFDTRSPRKPFAFWKNIEGLEPGDKEFLAQLLNLDPGRRPTAADVLKHPWFSST